jgi:hypothetical protein
MICPAIGENNAMMIEGIVSINLERNSMLGMPEKVWLMSGKDETMVIPDMMPSVATMRRAICRFLFVFCMEVWYSLFVEGGMFCRVYDLDKYLYDIIFFTNII